MGYLTSDTVWSLRERPGRLVVLGGGVVGTNAARVALGLPTARNDLYPWSAGGMPFRFELRPGAIGAWASSSARCAASARST